MSVDIHFLLYKPIIIHLPPKLQGISSKTNESYTIIDVDNGLSPVWHQDFIGIIAGLLVIV